MELGPGRKGVITQVKKMRNELDLPCRNLILREEIQKGILIPPAKAFPMEMYSPERIEEFDRENNQSIRAFLVKKAQRSINPVN